MVIKKDSAEKKSGEKSPVKIARHKRVQTAEGWKRSVGLVAAPRRLAR